jgi:hypothetical protein
MRETTYDPASFSAGRDCGTRVAACLVRLTALELTARARWWNRWRFRVMAAALVACAEELEREADEERGEAPERRRRSAAPALRALAAEEMN